MPVPPVLVHGNPESTGVWGPLIAALGRDDAGRGLAKARQRPGLALIALADAEQASGTPAQHRSASEAAGAEVAELANAGHWWPVTDPHPAAGALTAFWSRVDG